MKKELIIKEVLAEESKKENINNETSLVKEGDMEKAIGMTGKGNCVVGMKLKNIDIDSTTVSEDYCRIDSDDNRSLEESIDREGMIEPPLLNENEEGINVIVDGVKRLMAAKKKGMKKIPCLIIKGLTPAQIDRLSYIKNVERKTLSIIEVARHIRNMKDKLGYTLRELETMGYGSHSSISSKLKLLDLTEELQIKIHKGEITPGHGLALCKLSSPEEQKNLATQIGKGNMSVKSTEGYVDRYLAKKDPSKEDNAKKIVTSDDDVPGFVYFNTPCNMNNVGDKTINLLVSNITNVNEIETVMDEIGRVMAPGGRLAITVIDRTDSPVSNILQIKPTLPICQKRLQKHNIYLTDRIVTIRPADRCEPDLNSKRDDTPHTYYKIKNCSKTVYIFWAKGEREKPSAEIISQSKLSKEQEMACEKGVWEVELEEESSRIIQMYSYVGDKVLDLYLGDGTTLRVAKELGRVGIGYEKDIKNKPAIMKNLGLIPEETTVKSSKLMAAYVKQTMDPKVDITRLFGDAPAEGTNEDDLSVGKSSKPEPEFFGRMTQFEETDEEVVEEETVS